MNSASSAASSGVMSSRMISGSPRKACSARSRGTASTPANALVRFSYAVSMSCGKSRSVGKPDRSRVMGGSAASASCTYR